MKNNIIQTIKIITLSLILVLGVGYVQAQFQGPGGPAPQNNVDAPVNVGEASQIKSGNLGVDNFVSYANTNVQQTLGVNGTTQLRANYPTPDSYLDAFKLAVVGDTVVSGVVDSDFIPTLSPGVSSTPSTGPAVPTQSYAHYSPPATSSLSCAAADAWGIPCLIHGPTDGDGNNVDITVATGQLYQSLACISKNGELVLCQELYRNYPFGNK